MEKQVRLQSQEKERFEEIKRDIQVAEPSVSALRIVLSKGVRTFSRDLITVAIHTLLNQFDSQSFRMLQNHFPWNSQSSNATQALLTLPLRCSVPILKVQTQYPVPTTQHPKNQELQLRNNFFLVTDCSTNTVVSYFQCLPNVNILIKKIQTSNKIQKGQESVNQDRLGLVRMSHSENKKSQISFFFVLEEEKLIELYRTFPRTYTIQLDFHQLFKPVRKIGQGATSVVYQVVRFADKQPLAVKAFKKSTYFSVANGKGKEAFHQELKMLSECDHQGICRFEGAYETDNTIYVVQEYYEKSLISLLRSEGAISRQLVVSIMEDLLKAVQYLHSLGIFHRDIKLDNIMLRKQNDLFRPVLIDFGMAHYISNEEYFFEKCGTPGYIAPEVFSEGAKSPKGDIFSLGVIFHVLLFKTPVFSGQTREQVVSNNRNGILSVEQTKLLEEDELIKDLLLKMLEVDQKYRITAQQALKHPLFKRDLETPQSIASSSEGYQQVVERIIFNETSVAQMA